jgi:hypothetical protein
MPKPFPGMTNLLGMPIPKTDHGNAVVEGICVESEEDGGVINRYQS